MTIEVYEMLCLRCAAITEIEYIGELRCARRRKPYIRRLSEMAKARESRLKDG